MLGRAFGRSLARQPRTSSYWVCALYSPTPLASRHCCHSTSISNTWSPLSLLLNGAVFINNTLVCVFGSACTATRHLPPGDGLLG
ncbi:hypothetical protein FIBSPDRAFT_859525 [Athelia psychrophila]|uniref:Uncharacterized protein n=1 Tax=Athelia psychrophila TaxID=1759441 RepID=A0A166L111_9AGAM|nr:hypothetical protein FIBSPDRAFT_859525 [Fibularhizoctonia sp. CBS 109695]